MEGSSPAGDAEQTRMKLWLGTKPSRTVLRIAAAVIGAGVIGGGLALIWPEPDPMAAAPPSKDDPASLAPLPERSITLLLVGVDSEAINDPSNRAAPKGPANADSLILIRVEAGQALQVLQMPTELAVQLPGREGLQPLARAYREGGVALTADVIAEILGLPAGKPDRYLVMPRQALRTLVDGLGEVEVSLNQSYNREDKAQNYTVNLQAGRQTLNGSQAEQLARHRPNVNDDGPRRTRQESLLRGIHDQLRQPNAIALLPDVIGEVSEQISTDLTPSEMLSLTAAALSSLEPPVISGLKLAPRAGQQQLRELKPDQSLPLWPPGPSETAGN